MNKKWERKENKYKCLIKKIQFVDQRKSTINMRYLYFSECHSVDESDKQSCY